MKYYLTFGFTSVIAFISLCASIYGASHGIMGMGPGFAGLTVLATMATVCLYVSQI